MLLRSPLIEDGSKLVIGHDDVSVDLRDAVYVIEQPPRMVLLPILTPEQSPVWP